MSTQHYSTAGVFTNERVMLVDDNRVDNFINERILNSYRFARHIEIYANPLLAMEKLQSINPLAITDNEIPSYLFLDLNMPAMDGFAFLAEYQKLPARLKEQCRVVILTSSVDPNEFAKLRLTPGVFATLSKPLIKANLDELIAFSSRYQLVV